MTAAATMNAMVTTTPSLPGSERRRFERVPLTADLQTLSLAPVASDIAPVSLMDFSPDGAAVQSSVKPSWANGQATLDLRFGSSLIRCRAHVARIAWQNNLPVCGLRLIFDARERPALSALYHRLRFDALQRRGQLSEAALQQLFSESGYTRLKSDIAPSPTWIRANWPPTLTHDAVYVARDGQPIGHVSVTRAYPRAWLGHEIATLRHHPESMRCRRMLYLHFSVWPRLLDGEDAHLFGYYNRSRPWHQRMFEDFANRSAASDCVVLQMDRYTTTAFDQGAQQLYQGDGEPRVVLAGPADAGVVAEWVADYWPDLALRAFDIQAERLVNGCLHDAYREAGLTRSRSVLLLYVKGEPIAAALCEWTDSQISLFNVLNMAHLFVKRNAHLSVETSNLLVQEVRAFYAQRRVPPPLIVCPPGTFAGTELSGCTCTETMGCIVWSAQGLRHFERYINDAIAETGNRPNE